MDGTAVSIRAATPDDAVALHELKRALDRETSFMLLEPGERTTSASDVADELRTVAAQPNSVVLLADTSGEVVGYVEATGGAFRRNRHTAHVVIGIRQSHAGIGLGRRLLEELDRWARGGGILRLELTVMKDNERALALYRRVGYEVEGTRRAALAVDGVVVDELWMAKVLS